MSNFDVLSKQDIINIAYIDHGWSVGNITNSGVIFYVVDKEDLFKNCDDREHVLQNMQVGQNMRLVFIVNVSEDVGASIWVTLVIVYRHEQFFAYYIDPRGKGVDDQIQSHLRKQKIHCPTIEVKQTDSNTGMYALRNANVICKRLRHFEEGFSDAVSGLAVSRPGQGNGVFNDLSKEVFENRVGTQLSSVRCRGSQSNLDDKLYNVKYGDLDERLGYLCSKLKEHKRGEATFIIISPTSNLPSATLTLGFRDEQVVAWYVAHHNSDTVDVKNILSQKDIVTIFAKDDISEPSDFQKFALGVTKYIERNDDYSTSAKTQLLSMPAKTIKTIFQRYTLKLNAIRKIEDKIVKCASLIGKYVKTYGQRLSPTIQSYRHAQANLLILFLEAAALEDREFRVLGEQVKEDIRNRMMDGADITVINTIRSQHLLHRDKSIKKTIITCKDLNKFIQVGVSRVDFFKMLNKYLLQMIKKLNGETIDNEIRVSHFFKNKDEIQIFTEELENSRQKSVREVKEYLSQKFEKIFLKDILDTYSTDSQEIMFDLFVNIIPLLEGLYTQQGNKKLKKEELGIIQIEELRMIQKERNEFLHNFHTYGNEPARKFYLKQFIFDKKPTFFKFVFSEKVNNFLSQCTPEYTSSRMLLSIQNLFASVRSHFSKTKLLGAIPSPTSSQAIEDISTFFSNHIKLRRPINEGPGHQIDYPYIGSRSREQLQEFIRNYVHLMVPIDNEDQIHDRKKKEPKQPERYGQHILHKHRLCIYHDFNHLKTLSRRWPKPAEAEITKFTQKLQKLLFKCGILKPVFTIMVDLFVKDKLNINGNKFIDRICDQIVQNEMQESRPDEVVTINLTCGKRTKKTYRVSTRRFVENIRYLIQRKENEIGNLQEVFKDETFLSFLTHDNISFKRNVLNMLREKELFSEYVTKLDNKRNF